MRGFASLESAVAGHRVIDFGVSWMLLARQMGRRGHDLAPLAIAALDNLPVQPGFLDLGADCRRADCLAPSPMASRPIGSPGGARRQKRFGRTKIRVLYPLSAKRIQGHELPSAQKDRPLPQPAVPADPVATRRGIGGDHLASRFGSEILSTVVVDQPRRMKTQDRVTQTRLCGDRAQDKRASRITGTVDDDAFSGMPQHGKKLEIMTDFPSSTGFDPHFA